MYIRADRVAAVSERELFLETAEYAAESVESLGTRPVRALRLLGIGSSWLQVVPADDQGRMLVSELHLRDNTPTIVCGQAGEVNTGAFEAHRAATSVTASYLAQSDDGRERDGIDWTPEASRRARGFAVYAALRSLGRAGIAALVDGCCANARRFAKALDSAGAEILNDVVLNQVLVRFGDGERTRELIDRVQRDGTCWLGGTEWGGEHAMRISVSNWRSTADDVDRSVAAILAAAQVPA
jgi:glutamate/tyrosine decarboxylase-like PLP-dependent enzyme